jgi:hypothetical protein
MLDIQVREFSIALTLSSLEIMNRANQTYSSQNCTVKTGSQDLRMFIPLDVGMKGFVKNFGKDWTRRIVRGVRCKRGTWPETDAFEKWCAYMEKNHNFRNLCPDRERMSL